MGRVVMKVGCVEMKCGWLWLVDDGCWKWKGFGSGGGRLKKTDVVATGWSGKALQGKCDKKIIDA
jgi:hypothetical protein